MIYEDLRINFWIALDIAASKFILETYHVQNILQLIVAIIAKNEKSQQDGIKPLQYYCGVKSSILIQ